MLVGEVDVDCEINTDFLKDMFEEYFYYEKVYDETRLLINYSEYEKDASLKGEFIRMVLGSDMTEEQKSEVIRCGISALSGVGDLEIEINSLSHKQLRKAVRS